MSGVVIADDYLDPDVAYLLGLIVARGTILEDRQLYQIVIEIPYQNLQIGADDHAGKMQSFDIPTSIQLGLSRIRERILELMDCDIAIHETDSNYTLVLRLTRKTIGWRNLLLHLKNRTSYRIMDVPDSLFHPSATSDIRLEFIRGYADVAGNIRPANRYVDGRNRVRLDVLNDNWQLPVQICRLLQQTLDIPVQNITWGHPNLGRGFREHQINIFATPFQRIGFSLQHKQRVLSLLVDQDVNSRIDYTACPGYRRIRKTKPTDLDENSDKLPPPVRDHFDAYWQICKALGCAVEPPTGPLFAAVEEEIEET